MFVPIIKYLGDIIKIALLIDGLIARGGGERVAYFFAKRYNVDIYTAEINWDKILPEFRKFNIHLVEPEVKLPLINREFLIRKFESIDLSSYDIVVCLGPGYSTYAGIKNHPSILYAFGLSPLFYKRGLDEDKYWPGGKFYMKPIVDLWARRLKKSDKELISKHLDRIVCISKFTQHAVKAYYNRDSMVIGLPVNMGDYRFNKEGSYYLTVDRLIPAKRIDLVVRAFLKMPDKQLIVEGVGPELERLKEMAKGRKNIIFVGRVNSKKLIDLYSGCIALISMSYQQDWSMVMIEAMAAGKPGIGPNEGAYKEIITNNKNGVLVDASVEGIILGVSKITAKVGKTMQNACLSTASKYDEYNFYRHWDSLFRKMVVKIDR